MAQACVRSPGRPGEGLRVTGSDLAETDAIAALRELGAIINIGHQPDHLNGAEMVVVSTAILADNPELAAAKALGIPVVHRSELWAYLLNRGQGIAVAGTHGKTTITSLISWVLYQAGHDPTFLIGGEIPGLVCAMVRARLSWLKPMKATGHLSATILGAAL